MPLEHNITSSTHATQVLSVHPHYYMSNQQTKVQVPEAGENLLPCHILHLSIYINYFLAMSDLPAMKIIVIALHT